MPKPVPNRTVGLIGLGLMGAAMTERLVAAGFMVLGWDVAAQQRTALKKIGGQPVREPEEIFARTDRILLSLPDSNIVRVVLRTAKPCLRPVHIIADTSTGDPRAAVNFSAQLALSGAAYLDATISGNSDQVRSGDVTMMVGGTKPAFNRCKPVFQTFAARTVHTGLAGSGAQMKLVTNLVLGLNRAALAEGIAFARALGLDDRQAFAVMRQSMAYSRIMDVKGEKMLRGDFKPQARLSQHLKDVRLMLAAAAPSKTNLPLSETHLKILCAAEAAGLGSLDNSAIIRVISHRLAAMTAPKISAARRKP